MRNLFLRLICFLCTMAQVYAQSDRLSPTNNPANPDLLRPGSTLMHWFMINDTTEIKIGEVRTLIEKKGGRFQIITQVAMVGSNTPWVDSTLVHANTLAPIYHASYNQQRDIVLEFGDEVSGYYWDKASEQKTTISQKVAAPFFDSNFYPEFLRLLPLEKGYRAQIAIFDYNPRSKSGLMRATIQNTEKVPMEINGRNRVLWKVEVTDDISDNQTKVTYYFDAVTREKLLQEMEFGGRKMIMRSVTE